MSTSLSIIVPAVEVAWQVYSPPWDVRTGVNSSVLIKVPMGSLVITCWMSLTPLGMIHNTVGSPISESPSVRVTVQVSEKGSPADGISGGEILTVGGGSEGQKE